MVQPKLKEWAKKEKDRRGWSIRQIADEAGTAHSSIARVFAKDTNIGITTCVYLAEVFNADLLYVLELAEILPEEHEETHLSRQLNRLFFQLDKDKQTQLVEYARFLAEGQESQ